MRNRPQSKKSESSRRTFLKEAGFTGAALSVAARSNSAYASARSKKERHQTARVLGAFIYPPTSELRKVGYFSWPGSTFDAEGRQKEYMKEIKAIESRLDMSIEMEKDPIDESPSVTRFVNKVKKEKPDGLFIVLFKKRHWGRLMRIIEETGIPAVVFATLGNLLIGHINQLHRRKGAYLIHALDDFKAMEDGMRIMKTARRMRDSRIVNITGSATKEATTPHLGTSVRTIPMARFVHALKTLKGNGAVKELAESYRNNAEKIVRPTPDDILDGAKTYFALKQLIKEENGDAVMVNCLPGLKKPHKHPPLCMGFMSLRDQGIPAGCQSDLSSTLTMMLVQELFNRPGFQQNASVETEKNRYFGAHCTSPSKLNGPDKPPEPYILMSHAEAGWGCVPRVLWKEGKEVTMAQYRPGKNPRMHIYTGEVLGCPPVPRTGGCRTNVEMTINEVEDVCEVKGMHQIIFYGNHAKELRTFCQLYGIDVVM